MDLAVLFTAGVFLIGFLSFLLVGVNTLLKYKIDPLKENQARFEKRLDKLEAGQRNLEKGQDRLESLIKELLQDRK